jgi:hypothetical protein
MPSTAIMNVSNASFTNVSTTNINASNASITNASMNLLNVNTINVTTINGLPYGTVSTNMSFTNLSVTGNFSMPSTAIMNVSNALFTNVSATKFVGILTGNAETATTATNTTITLSANPNTTHYPVFKSGTSGNLGDIVDTELTYNPSTNTLTAGTFVGSLTGNVTGTVTGSSGSTTGNAATASAVSTTAINTDGTYYPCFKNGTSGNLADLVDSNLTYNPSTNTLTAGTFVGSLSGNATSATSATTTTGNAATASAVSTTATDTAGTYYPCFKNGTSGNLADLVDSNLTYNPSTNTLTAGIISTNTLLTSSGTTITYYGTTHSFISGTPSAPGTSATVNAAIFNSTSDIRFKNIIRSITVDETLNFIHNTNPVLFKWKDNNDDIIAGYIAQEVIKTQADHLVYTGDNIKMKESLDGPEGKQYYLNYDGIIPYHGVAIKHILEENIKMKEDVKDLSTEVKDLSNKVDNLSKELDGLKDIIKTLVR